MLFHSTLTYNETVSIKTHTKLSFSVSPTFAMISYFNAKIYIHVYIQLQLDTLLYSHIQFMGTNLTGYTLKKGTFGFLLMIFPIKVIFFFSNFDLPGWANSMKSFVENGWSGWPIFWYIILFQESGGQNRKLGKWVERWRIWPTHPPAWSNFKVIDI